MNKEKLKQVLIELEEHTIEEANMNHEDYLTENQLDRESVVDADDQSHHRANIELSERLDKQLLFHEEDLKTLIGISFEATDVVQPGAVVRINGRCIVVAVSKPKFQFDGRDFIGISTDAPIYEKLDGKRTGDQFIFNDIEFKIEAVN